MKNITLENQINSLYKKAELKKQQNLTDLDQADTVEQSSPFSNTLKNTIKRMSEISNEADTALKSLDNSKTKDEKISAEIAQADSIYQRMMKEQDNLSALYQKLKLKDK